MDLDEAVLYGLAGQLGEANIHRGSGRWRSNAAAGGTLEEILAEVLERIPTGVQGGAAIIREAVEDVTEGRRPKW